MQRTALVLAGLVLAASLVGAAGPAVAQSDDDMVTLTIEVVNPSTNQRLGGVTLVATWDGGETRATTASNGMVFVDVPEAASVEITPDDPEYTRNEPYFIRVATEKEHTIEVFRKADLDVSVTDAEGPVADARVTLSQDGIEVVSGRTDGDGLYRSGTVAQGRYTLSVVKPGYYRTTEEVIVAGSPEETVRIERGRVDYDVVVEDPHFDPARAVPDATVSVEGVGEEETDDRGATTTLLPVNSRLEVTVSKEGYETVAETVTTNESAGSLTVELSREQTLSLTALNERVVVGEVVPVEVTNAYGEPASGVAIVLDGERVARTDGDGRATVRIESGGEHELRARQGSTTSASVTIQGVGEGGQPTDEAQTTAGAETDAETTAPAGQTGASPLTTYGPILLVVLLVGAAAVFLYRRRQSEPSNPWDDGEDGDGFGGSAGVNIDDRGDGGDGGVGGVGGGVGETLGEGDGGGTTEDAGEGGSAVEPGTDDQGADAAGRTTGDAGDESGEVGTGPAAGDDRGDAGTGTSDSDADAGGTTEDAGDGGDDGGDDESESASKSS